MSWRPWKIGKKFRWKIMFKSRPVKETHTRDVTVLSRRVVSAAGPARQRATAHARYKRRLTTPSHVQNNTGPLGGPVILVKRTIDEQGVITGWPQWTCPLVHPHFAKGWSWYWCRCDCWENKRGKVEASHFDSVDMVELPTTGRGFNSYTPGKAA